MADAVRPTDVEHATMSPYLGDVSGVPLFIARTSTPWEMDVDTLIISAGPDGLGGLGHDVREHVAGVRWDEARLSELTPERPQVLTVDPSPAGGLRRVVLACARDVDLPRAGVAGDFPGTPDAVRRSAAAGVAVAIAQDARVLALPLLGAGVIGMPTNVAAEATLTGVLRVLQADTGPLMQVYFLAIDDSTAMAVERAWERLADGRQSVADPAAAITRAAVVAEPAGSADGGLTAGSTPWHDLTPGVLDVLRYASAVVDTGWYEPGVVDPALVLLAAFVRRNNPRREPQGGVASRLLSALAGDEQPVVVIARLAEALGLPVEEVLTLAPDDADLAPSTAGLADLAREVPRRLGLTPLTHVRHLLATVTGGEPDFLPPVVEALGVSVPELRRLLRGAVEAVVPAEAPAGWDQLLGVVTAATELAGGFSRDIVGSEERIPPTDDLLGVGTYVSMLASVIARRDTPLPLSVALFGEWGSGKSYFMGLLRDRVHTLSQSGDDAYLGEIVPITFNAWHYADTNLWASLGNEIFEQLAGPEATAAQRRGALRSELAEKTQRAQDLRAANRRAEEETARLRAELDRAQTAAGTSSVQLLRAVPRSPVIQQHLTKAFKRLGVSAEAEQAQLLSEELSSARTEADALRLSTRGPRGWMPVAVAVLALGALALSVFFADDLARLLAGGGLTGLAAALGWLTVVVARARSGLHTLSTAAAEIRAEASRSADERLAPEYEDLRRKDARAAVIESQLTEVLERVGEIGRELADFDPGRRFYGFVADRAISDDYRRELGLISTIRRDFEQLITLMREWHQLDEPERHQPIDRIVLYIDDLDRCSAEQVVDVLQAVHLLLALDLFVVVVGVDPRWLLHSLSEQYRTAFRGSDQDSRRGADLTDDEAVWRTTPHDYLEKIFNIPFVLPGMTSTSFERLIRELSLGEPQGRGGARPESGDQSPGKAALGVPMHGGDASGERGDAGFPENAVLTDQGTTPGTDRRLADVPVQEGSEVAAIGAGRKPVPRRLNEFELKLLASLGPLVRSPRQAKRLLNLYRMVRSTRDLSPASDFLGADRTPGEYQAVGVLLGLLTAHPRLLGQLLAAESADGLLGGLCVRPVAQTWGDVIAGLLPLQVGGSWRNDVCNDLSADDRAEWASLVARVTPASVLVTLPDLQAFRFWGPRVARFSFLLSPLALQEDSTRRTAAPTGGVA
jgi:hypothetical protein